MFYAQSYSRKNGKTLIVATLAISLSVIAHSNTVQGPSVAPSVTGLSSNKPVTVYFMNGINNSEVQAQTSTIALFNRLKEIPKFSNLVNNKQVSLRTLYNPSSPLLGDVYELDAQASIQKTALLATDNRIKAMKRSSVLSSMKRYLEPIKPTKPRSLVYSTLLAKRVNVL